MKIIIGVILSYLLGAIPTAYIFAKFIKGIDIREHGSGNIGATNALRLMGKLPGLLVLIIDLGKGLLAVTLISAIFSDSTTVATEMIKTSFGLAAVCGHVFNVFMGFKGGKGVATAAGVILGLTPVSLVLAAAIFLAIVIITRFVSLGSLISCVSIPFIMLICNASSLYVLASALLAMLIVIKHKQNIKRLLAGTEKKIFEK